ncbi:MAG: cell division protein FtsL [Chloroflexi bacterium]|nr:cell division protein FtsL [Chloroflexota bacterium]
MATIQRTGRHIVSDILRSPSMPTLLIISALVIGAAALIPLVQSSIATTTNGNVRFLEQQRDDWQAQTQELELDVATMAGLNRIEKEARESLKMVEPKETRYITVPVEAPAPRRLPSRYLRPTADEREAEPGAWKKLLDWLPLP